MTDRICIVDDCTRAQRAMELCATHYAYQRRKSSDRPRCSIEGCESATTSRGLCNLHYQRWAKGALPVTPPRVFPQPPGRTCTVEGCLKLRKADGLCSMHLHRKYRDGDPGEAAHRHAPSAGMVCSEPGCERPARSRQMCRHHYRYTLIAEGGYPSGPWALTVEQLVERDGYVCWICGLAVDLSIRRPDTMCPSVDHVTALSRGGLDLPENVALAHLLCNMRKGCRPT